jgi:hypothetical protein
LSAQRADGFEIVEHVRQDKLGVLRLGEIDSASILLLSIRSVGQISSFVAIRLSVA